MSLKFLGFASSAEISSMERVARWLLHLGQVPTQDFMETTVIMDSIHSEMGSISSFQDISEQELPRPSDPLINETKSASSTGTSMMTISGICEQDVIDMVTKWVQRVNEVDPDDLLPVVIYSVSESGEALTSYSTTYDKSNSVEDDNVEMEEVKMPSDNLSNEEVRGEPEPICGDILNSESSRAENSSVVEYYVPETGHYISRSVSLSALATIGYELAMRRCGSLSGFPLGRLPPASIVNMKPPVLKSDEKSLKRSGGEKKTKRGKLRKAFSKFARIVFPCCFTRTDR